MTDINAKDEFGETALIRAVRSPLVWRGSGIEMRQEHEKGDVAALIAAGADVNIENDIGMNALMYAAYAEYACFSIATIWTLIDAGANIHATNKIGDTALIQATRWGGFSSAFLSVKALLEAGANVNGTDSDKLTPLMIACWDGNEALCELLLSAGADASIKDGSGNTALFCANNFAKPKKVKIAMKLIAAGADVRAVNCIGETALSMAKRGNDEKLISFLHEKTHEHLVQRKSVLVMQAEAYEYSF